MMRSPINGIDAATKSSSAGDPQKRISHLLNIPRIVVAATHSGAGKTSVAVALAAALRERGLRVQTFKVGPDFLDPTYLSMASGRPCYNLDGWMMGKDYVAGLFTRVTADADIAIIEGVMGLFDGANPVTSEGSTAEIARLLKAPVLLVTDAKGASRSVAAQVKGFAVFEPGISLVGVVANRCASASHAELLTQALASASLPPLAGFMGPGAFPTLGGRHLGLVTADTGTLPTAAIAAFAAAGEKNLFLATIIELARKAEPLAAYAAPATAGKKKIPVAVAYDRAFHFYYQDTWDALKSCGGELLFYSPLKDKALPEGAAGLYIGGGYPEVYAEELAANHAMGEALRAFTASGRPVYAECGGLMYLSESLETTPGKRYPMSGVLPAGTRMGSTKKFLGYVEATLKEDSLWGRKGDLFRGHEFHYSELTSGGVADPRWQTVYALRRNRPGTIIPEGYQCGNILASYAHLHYASRPEAVSHFIAKCGGAL